MRYALLGLYLSLFFREIHMLLCGIIKPHALHQTRDILGILTNASIIIHETKGIIYSRMLVDILYDHMSTEIRVAIANDLVGNEGLALLLTTQSIEHLLEVAGRESDPAACAPKSIRGRFGVHSEPLCVGNERSWKNAFHRPIDLREADRDMRAVFGVG
jgi:hypothetical protein